MKTLRFYITVLTLILFSSINANSQIVVTHFNADWNSANDVEWIDKLSDCDISKVDIVEDPKLQDKHEIVVVPTIIVFNGKEVKRFQADISFAMKATKKEVQAVVDEILMDQF